MKIKNLTLKSQIYTSNAYLLTGTWNTLSDLNTLIDVGRDPLILEKIEDASTGVGKKRIEQVILTHNHYDHAHMLTGIKKLYKPVVYAFSSSISSVDIQLKGGEILKVADKHFEVIHTPGHSSDSICLYCEEDKVLFSGDTPLIIKSHDNSYDDKFINILKYLLTKEINTIYPGHGEPLKTDCRKLIHDTFKNISRA